MQVNNLPLEIQNKVFYFLEHPTASIIRGHTIDHYYHEFYNKAETETQRFCVESYQIESQLRHKLKVKYITEEETKKLDPLFLHMNKEMIERTIFDHYLIERSARRYLCEECYCELKGCQCFIPC